jgi:hypothetical protein
VWSYFHMTTSIQRIDNRTTCHCFAFLYSQGQQPYCIKWHCGKFLKIILNNIQLEIQSLFIADVMNNFFVNIFLCKFLKHVRRNETNFCALDRLQLCSSTSRRQHQFLLDSRVWSYPVTERRDTGVAWWGAAGTSSTRHETYNSDLCEAATTLDHQRTTTVTLKHYY